MLLLLFILTTKSEKKKTNAGNKQKHVFLSREVVLVNLRTRLRSDCDDALKNEKVIWGHSCTPSLMWHDWTHWNIPGHWSNLQKHNPRSSQPPSHTHHTRTHTEETSQQMSVRPSLWSFCIMPDNVCNIYFLMEYWSLCKLKSLLRTKLKIALMAQAIYWYLIIWYDILETLQKFNLLWWGSEHEWKVTKTEKKC